MNLSQRAEFERQLKAYAEIFHRKFQYGGHDNMRNEHNARCDLITWIEKNVEKAAPIADTSGGP